MVPAIPGGEGLFSVLQLALQHGKPNTPITFTSAVQYCLQEWQSLADSLPTYPTYLSDLVPTPPHYIGACDASGIGMGGVWLPLS
jgi:hypothetical protein